MSRLGAAFVIASAVAFGVMPIFGKLAFEAGVSVTTLLAVRFAMAYWYQSQSRVLTGEIETRLQLLSDSLLQRPADVGLVRVMTQLRTADGSERTVVPAFSSALVPELQRSWK